LAGNPKHEYRNPKQNKMVCLKKQNQFGKPQMTVTVCVEWDYGNKLDWILGEKQSQTKPITRFRTAQMSKKNR